MANASQFGGLPRSELMSRIRSRGNKRTELALKKLFRVYGITGWRRHIPIFGNPDFIFRKAKLAIFVDGCFWHGCPKCYRAPSTNKEFWKEKIERNRLRDKKVSKELRATGWQVLRIWEHELARKNETRLLQRILRGLVWDWNSRQKPQGE